MQLAPIFQDHAVFQRDHPIPVWGTAAPETRITVQLADLTALAVTGSDGRWIARLPACPAGGPHALYIEADDGSPAVVCEDILVGEVWVCSGQSNMEYPLNQLDPNGDQSRGANFPHLRLLTLSTPAKGSLQTAIDGRWAPATSDSMAKFSAVAGWFGRSLAPLNVPVGLIANAWGGTRIQAWLSREALMSDPDGRQELARYEPLLHSAENTTFFGNYDDWFRACGPEDSQNAGIRDGWHRPDFDDAGWPSMNLPCHWQDHGHDHSGIFWFRRRVALPPAWHGRDLLLNLGAIDKHDDTFVNGHRIGGIAWENLNSWCTPRHYPVPAQFHDGASELVIAVRVRSHQYHGGMTGPAATMHIHPSDDPAATIALAGDWAFTVEQNWGIIPAPVLADCGPRGAGDQEQRGRGGRQGMGELHSFSPVERERFVEFPRRRRGGRRRPASPHCVPKGSRASSTQSTTHGQAG